MKKFFNSLFQNQFFAGALRKAENLTPGRPNEVTILTYHRIDNSTGFAQQMEYLAATRHVASMSELIAACRGETRLPARSVAITFDDAYANFAETAWPILKRFGLTATLFVPTAYPSSPEPSFWWDRLEFAFTHTHRRDPLSTPVGRLGMSTGAQRLRSFKQLRTYVKTRPHEEAMALVDDTVKGLDVETPPSRVLNWDALRSLAADGVTLGAHTRTHPFLTRVPLQRAREEACASLDDLRREIGHAEPIFAYPDGQFTPEVVQALGQDGFELAFTTIRGTNNLDRPDCLRLRRNDIGRVATRPILQARLLQAASGF